MVVANFIRMIRKLIIALGVLCAVSIAFVVVRVTVRAQQQQAIVAVLNQACAANLNATHVRTMRNGRSITNFSVKDYLAGIETISTAQCPEDFRLAWLNYIQTLQRDRAPFSGLGAITEFEVSTLKTSPSGEKDALARLDKLNGNEAWMHVETKALDYGVQLVRK
jgi:hypothetical protein